jgi:hypothetical protein
MLYHEKHPWDLPIVPPSINPGPVRPASWNAPPPGNNAPPRGGQSGGHNGGQPNHPPPLASVPEPSTGVMILSGLILGTLAATRRLAYNSLKSLRTT